MAENAMESAREGAGAGGDLAALTNLPVLDYDVLARMGLWKRSEAMKPPQRGETHRQTVTNLQCTIPVSMVSKFVRGEEARGNTNFNKHTKLSKQRQQEKTSEKV